MWYVCLVFAGQWSELVFQYCCLQLSTWAVYGLFLGKDFCSWCAYWSQHCHSVIALSQEYVGMVEVPSGPLFWTQSYFCSVIVIHIPPSAHLPQPTQPPLSVSFLVCKSGPWDSWFQSTAHFLGTQSLKTSSIQSLRNESDSLTSGSVRRGGTLLPKAVN